MTPDERKVLTELFERVRSASGNTRDAEAEAFIAENVRAQPYAPYLLSQAVIVQEEALKNAVARIEELERDLEATRAQPAAGGFLGGIFGGGAARPQPQAAAMQQRPAGAPPVSSGPWAHQRSGSVPMSGAPMSGAQQGGPWAGQQQQPQQGGSFLRGALGMAAGVAGGVLLANSLQGMFGGAGGDKHGIAGDTANAGAGAGASTAATDSAIAGNTFDQQASAPAPAPDHIQPASYDEGGWDSGGDDSWDA